MNKLDVVSRGLDTSGRPLRATRQFWQHSDRVNRDAAGGMLVPIQGGFMGAAAAGPSASTHRLAMCGDFREWNLTTQVKIAVTKRGRDLMGTWWLRTVADGFDPHFHTNLIGDAPADGAAIAQVSSYRLGLNGLANRQKDRNPYRPAQIHNYRYLPEDDMFEKEDRERQIRIEKLLLDAQTQDQRDREVEKRRFQRLVAMRGRDVDRLTLLINSTRDAATKAELKRMQEGILLELKNDPDVKLEDNPSDDALGDRNMG